jgi:hypothetical protein
MKLSRHRDEPVNEPPPDPGAPGLDALTGGHFGEDDARPTREERQYGQTIFTRPPVKVPKFLRKKGDR